MTAHSSDLVVIFFSKTRNEKTRGVEKTGRGQKTRGGEKAGRAEKTGGGEKAGGDQTKAGGARETETARGGSSRYLTRTVFNVQTVRKKLKFVFDLSKFSPKAERVREAAGS